MSDITFFVILGVIQGLLEWLPLSSSGNVTLLLVNIAHVSFSEAVKVSFFLHMGTMLSVVVRFRSRLLDLGRDVFSLRRTPEVTFYSTATVISAIIGIPFYLLLEIEIPELIGSLLIAFFLIITGMVIRNQKKGLKSVKDISPLDAVLVGAAQGIAVLPGISRSGLTMAALLSRGLDQKEALSLSFLLSIPPVTGLMILGFSQFHWLYLISLAASFVCSLLTMEILLKTAQKLDFSWFCFAVALVTIVAVLFLY